MNYERVVVLFFRSVTSGNADAMLQASPDARLVHPVGGYGFPLREFHPAHGRSAQWSLACSGLRAFSGDLK